MGTTLDNGIYLPDEGERNCYDGLAGNWVALDNHLGSTDIHVTINDKQAWNGHIADSVKHVTAEDKQAWNGKADASALTAHTGDTTIHVTSADKQAWNGHVADTTIHVTSADKQAWNGHIADSVKHVTAEDKAKWDAVTSKANDSDVVHKSGNETVGGNKTFTGEITNNISNKASASITLKNSSYDPKTNGQSNANSSSFSISFNTLTDDSFAYISAYGLPGYSLLRLTTTYFTDSENSITDSIEYRIYPNGDRTLRPRNQNNCTLGETSRRWKDCQTNLINGLTPSSLSMPTDNIANIIDISGYLTMLDGSRANTYQAPANGWISITMGNCSGIQAYINGLWGHQVVRQSTGGVRFLMPILKDKTANILIFGGTIDNARFIPCQGNV